MNDYIQHIIDNGERVVIDSEPVPAMTRPLLVHYVLNGEVVIETITYTNDANDAGWAAVATVNYELENEEGYKTIEL
jgi:hypothetical protein